jgi:hypothetical protein
MNNIETDDFYVPEEAECARCVPWQADSSSGAESRCSHQATELASFSGVRWIEPRRMNPTVVRNTPDSEWMRKTFLTADRYLGKTQEPAMGGSVSNKTTHGVACFEATHLKAICGT